MKFGIFLEFTLSLSAKLLWCGHFIKKAVVFYNAVWFLVFYEMKLSVTFVKILGVFDWSYSRIGARRMIQ